MYSHFAIFINQFHRFFFPSESKVQIFFTSLHYICSGEVKKKFELCSPKGRNKFVKLVIEDGEVTVRGVVTFEVASLH